MRDGDEFYTGTITVGLISRDKKMKVWDGVSRSRAIIRKEKALNIGSN